MRSSSPELDAPIAPLIPAEPPRERELGLERDQIWISPAFDDPMPDDWLNEWER